MSETRIQLAPKSNVINVISQKGYPPWPSYQSMVQIGQALRSRNLAQTTRYALRIHRYLNFWVGSVGNPAVPIFIKEDSQILGRGSFSHELRVTQYLNGLRKVIPFFGYTFGYWTIRGSRFLISENIPGTILRDFVVSASLSEIIQVYLIVLRILDDAYQRIGFTHYDLSANNVIVQTLLTPCRIRIGSSIVVSKYMVYLIDFDRSYTYNTGGCELPGRFIFDQPNPAHDLYYLTVTVFRHTSIYRSILQFINVAYNPHQPIGVNLIRNIPRMILRSVEDFVQFFVRSGYRFPVPDEEPWVFPETIKIEIPDEPNREPFNPIYGTFQDKLKLSSQGCR